MQIAVTFKNIDPSENLKRYAGEKLERLDKYLDNPAEAAVVLSVEKHRHIAEISIFGDRLNINGKEEAIDMYAAIDLTLDKLEKQIKKSKEKIRERKGKLKSKPKAFGRQSPTEAEGGERLIKVRYVDYKPMDVEEAVMQMELTHNNFFVFTNARTEQINVLYRRNDGHLGLIQPSA
ncbi:MAG: ribosome-associated translation inhibitor RaiA [Deltaproteobacteria bacterium]|nr:ribosome-associated translation inhibitor RaiA [Deltaproteobacteria bacterium]MBW1954620.1 ribosome-associated translation inhibitor RaiA [Deltaproteobacteria bacterium]MBW2042285.1 ribosome-associated translation inhibitor RaiA [Deltaproteobacteria bacterium]MBW2131990.1 ribosome-associated translation inhibitor RaiA [Deltaproteobacteria bacterium]